MSHKLLYLLLAIFLITSTSTLTGSMGRHDISDVRHESSQSGLLGREMGSLIDSLDDDCEVSLLVRLRDDSYLHNNVFFSEMGLDVLASFNALPVVTLKGRVGDIRELQRHPAIERIENDTAVKFMMERSLRTVNATKVWDARIREDGDQLSREKIDGSGVTVVILDTGIDADHPDLDYGEKTIVNLKANIPGGPWHERINTDTSYGHGTHCAGTVAGNGDASAGARRGVAPGANLIGLSVGDIGITLTNVVGGLEWVYDNTKPGANEHNIRIVSNSWGTSGKEWDPEDTISQLCYKLAVENNVVCIFAAGNAGEDDHDGHEITTSPYANTPVNVGVAALERDGSGMAYFSSRGKADMIETWPDVGAPGVKIWSAHARKTLISAMNKLQGSNPNPYYLAISGTSMATPHVSGLAALMFQACPSLRMSDQREDWNGGEEYGLDWDSSPETRIHEVEEILELTTEYVQSGEGIPEEGSEIGRNERRTDFAQGYGLIKSDVAVGVCLVLQRLREKYPEMNISARDAYEVFQREDILVTEEIEDSSGEFLAAWEGEYSRWNDITQAGFSDTQNQTKYVYIPNTTGHVRFLMTYQVTSAEDLQTGDLSYEIDVGGDGSVNYRGPIDIRMEGQKELNVEVDADKVGKIWKIDIVGRGLKVPITAFNPDRSYVEIRVEYDASIAIRSRESNATYPPFPLIPGWDDPHMVNFYPLEGGAGKGTSTSPPSKLDVYVYDLDRVKYVPEKQGEPDAEKDWWPFLIVAALVVIALSAAYILHRRKKRGGKADSL